MRLKFVLSLLVPVILSANAQELTEIASIEPGKEVRDFRVERPSEKGQQLLLAFLSGGGLNVYSAKGEALLRLSGVEGSVLWGDTYLHNNRFYFISQGLQFVEFRGTNSKVTKMTSRALLRNDYESFVGAVRDSSQIMVASHPLGIDVYRFPSLELIAQLKRDEYLKYSSCLVWHGMLVAAVRKNQLVGYDIGGKQIVWTLNSGEYHPKYLGISLGTSPRWINHWKVNADDQMLYVTTMDGSLYKLEPQTGTIAIQKLQFRGGGNNAGLLTCLYFTDVTGDGRKDLVAPSVDNNLYCINPEDISVRWSYDTDNECQMPLAFYDLTGDGKPEIFCVNDYDLDLSIIDGTSGKSLGKFSLKDRGSYKQIRIAVADLDGDGSPELLAQSSTWKKIRIFRIPQLTSPKR